MLSKVARPLRSRLGLKLSLLATAVPVVVLLAFGRSLVASDRRSFHATYQERAVAIARITAAALREPAVMGEWDVIDDFVATAVAGEEALAFAYVRRADGKRVACKGAEGLPDSVLAGSGIVDGRFAVRRGPIELEGEVLGWVVIGLSLAQPEAALKSRNRVVLASAGGVGLLTALLLLLALRLQVMRPLAELGAHVKRLGKGEYEDRIDIDRIDELGALAGALDRMRCELRKSWSELKEQHAEQLRLLDQLSAALQQARAADIAKGRFLATVSHEVRTPLNGIIGMAGLLELTELNAEQREFVTTLVSSGRGLVGLIDDVLDFSTLDSHDVELSPSEADVGACTREVLELAVAGLDHDRIRTSVSIGEDVPRFVRCDALRLRQVLWNVVGNAAKYTQAGSIEVRIGLERAPQRGERDMVLRFEVQDTGVGIARADLERIFGPFSQVDESDSRRYGGTGLGLAIAKQIVELMGGQIGVCSELGVGSTFWFTTRAERSHIERERRATLDALSITERMDAAARVIALGASSAGALMAPDLAAAADASDAEASNATPSRSLVLIAEDNPVNQALARRSLERVGVRIALAADGLEALELFDVQQPTLVLMDCQMPRLDGFGATRAIRERESERGLSRTPIVAVTANAMPGDRERCLEHGMDDYLAKPYRPAELIALVEQWLETAARAAR